MELILASNSPRRKELLRTVVSRFRVVPSRFEERPQGLSAEQTARCFASGKAREVFSRFPEALVLGADTVVALGGEILGKPRDGEDARRMLRLLSGKVHLVYTGVCLIGRDFCRETVVKTEVGVNPLGEAFIEAYVAGGSPLDKAGAYGIQDGGIACSLRGSYTNVVGLPVEEVKALLLEATGGRLC